MLSQTDEFSFELKPSLIPGAGIGVFTTHDIKVGTQLALYPGEVTQVTFA